MKILLTGATGYIGARLIIRLLNDGHFVYVLARNPSRFNPPPSSENKIKVIKGDVLDALSLKEIPSDIDAAYYLVHSMSTDSTSYDLKDRIAANNFMQAVEKTACKQIVYLSGIANDENLSKHLTSRLEVENILKTSKIPLTTLRAAIIIGAGSASFEIIRDLVEKLPIMIAPKWVNSKCQPISIVDVIDYLAKVLGNEKCLNLSFDIGGPETFTYKEMLLKFAAIRGLKRKIFIVPVLTPKLSSHWLFFITTVSLDLTKALISSLKNDAVCHNSDIETIIEKKCLLFEEAIRRAFQKIQDNDVLSSWKDAWSGSGMPAHYLEYVKVPTHGCLTWTEKRNFSKKIDPQKVMDTIYHMGGNNGYYINWAWKLRGFIDRIFGGVGLRRGKVARAKPRPGDALDFWRVILVDDQKHRFLLFAEMKVPGEAWLEFYIENLKDTNLENTLVLKATFRPHGVFGRVYWYSLWPIHLIIFKGLVKKILKISSSP